MIKITSDMYAIVLHNEIVYCRPSKESAEKYLKNCIEDGWPRGIEDGKVMPLEDWFEATSTRERVEEFLLNCWLSSSIMDLKITQKHYVYASILGDWKHEHESFKAVMEQIFNMEELDYKEIDDDDYNGGDYYEAYYKFKPRE